MIVILDLYAIIIFWTWSIKIYANLFSLLLHKRSYIVSSVLPLGLQRLKYFLDLYIKEFPVFDLQL